MGFVPGRLCDRGQRCFALNIIPDVLVGGLRRGPGYRGFGPSHLDGDVKELVYRWLCRERRMIELVADLGLQSSEDPLVINQLRVSSPASFSVFLSHYPDVQRHAGWVRLVHFRPRGRFRHFLEGVVFLFALRGFFRFLVELGMFGRYSPHGWWLTWF